VRHRHGFGELIGHHLRDGLRAEDGIPAATGRATVGAAAVHVEPQREAAGGPDRNATVRRLSAHHRRRVGVIHGQLVPAAFHRLLAGGADDDELTRQRHAPSHHLLHRGQHGR
jgi:hypothetical protein